MRYCDINYMSNIVRLYKLLGYQDTNKKQIQISYFKVLETNINETHKNCGNTRIFIPSFKYTKKENETN
jgi:hypothetical protein